MFLVAFLVALLLVLAHVARLGDARDRAAGMVLSLQFILEHVLSGNLLASATVFASCLFMFVIFSVKLTGTLLGLCSGLAAVIAVLAWFGVVPAQAGQGVAFNYHHWVTLVMYLQMLILWRMTGARNDIPA